MYQAASSTFEPSAYRHTPFTQSLVVVRSLGCTPVGFLDFISYSKDLNLILIVLTYINISAVSNGVDDAFAFYLVSIANASSLCGRLGGGLLADRIGAYFIICSRIKTDFLTTNAGAINVMTPFTLVAGIMTFVWPFVSGKSNYIAIAIVYG